MAQLTQEKRLLLINTPLGEGAFLLTSLTGEEKLSRLFRYELEMVSSEDGVAPEEIVGKNVTFAVQRPEEDPRYFNGFVSRFSNLGRQRDDLTLYRAEVVPWLWFLTRTADCRIFQEKTVVEIIEQIFGDLGFSDFETSEIRGTHPKWNYCVQYRETDFNFVSRLAEHEGIFYYFRHEDGKHTLVMADDKTAYKALPENEVPYVRDRGDLLHEEHITSWEHQYEFRPGKVAQTDYNFETPSTDLMTQESSIVKLPGIDKYEVYDYPAGCESKSGNGRPGEPLTRIRMEEEETPHDIVSGSSTCKTFTPGGKFTIKGHPNSSEDGKSYVITSIRHEASNPVETRVGGTADESYENTFDCIPESVIFRPARITRKPFVQGPQTAVVVGPPGEEIYPDEFGRVKVQFHWDREGKKDENSSCWMRVSQVHAGKGFGGIDIPRIGEEVIVGFLEGDPDAPLIIGRVYNAELMPPFGLPGKKSISGMKSNSTKGGGGYNEFVLDDTKGNELIRVHGQYDMDSTIENDLREHVLNNRSRDVAVDETVSIGNNQDYSIGVNQTGSVGADKTLTIGANHTESIGSNMTINIGSTLTETVGINYAENVGAAMELTVGGLMTQTIGAYYALSVGAYMDEEVGASKSTNIGANLTETVGAKHAETVGGPYTLEAATITLKAKSKIMLKTGGSSITMTSGGNIVIKGTNIKVKGSAKVVEEAATISSKAKAKNAVTGALVDVKASGINTIKGALVKIN